MLSLIVILSTFLCSGSTVNVGVALEREDEVAGPVLAPLFPQVYHHSIHVNHAVKIFLRINFSESNAIIYYNYYRFFGAVWFLFTPTAVARLDQLC